MRSFKPELLICNRSKKLLLLLASLGLCAQSTTAWAQVDTSGSAATKTVPGTALKKAESSSSKTEFLRMTMENGEPDSLQVAMTRYRLEGDNDVIVDLIGAVHIGEGDYYRKLNKQFELYDVVLYELVAPQGTRVPKGKKKASSNPLSMLQVSAQRLLGLESQLELIDYQKDNFVHADMSPAEISKKMEERGQSALSLGMSAFSEMMSTQKKLAKELSSGSANSYASKLASKGIFELMNNPLELKRMMAGQFTQTGVMEGGLGKTLNRLLIVDRNAAAVKVLKEQMDKGKTRIAIFYGAAHMNDFEERLTKEFGMKKTKQVWMDAWDLKTAPKAAKKSSPSSMLFDMLKQMDR